MDTELEVLDRLMSQVNDGEVATQIISGGDTAMYLRKELSFRAISPSQKGDMIFGIPLVVSDNVAPNEILFMGKERDGSPKLLGKIIVEK